MISSTFSYLKSFLPSSPQRSGKDESASTTSQRRSPVVAEPFEKPIAVEDGQIVAETKPPTTRVTDNLADEPMDMENRADIGAVTAERKKQTPTPPAIDEPSDEPMGTENRANIGQVTDEPKKQTPTPPVIDEPSDEPMGAVTSTSDDNDDDRVHPAEDPEARNNVAAPSAGKRNRYDHWRMEERKAFAQHLVRKEKEALEKLKEAKDDKDKKFRLPNKFWAKCATALEKKGCNKTNAQCSNQVYMLCKISKDEMKNDFELNEEEVDLLFGLWSRKKLQTRRPKGATVRGERDKETWASEEEAEFASYLVRDRKENLKKNDVFYLMSDCADHFNGARSKDAYRSRARKMRGYDDDTLRDVHKLTDEEIELFRGPWLDNKKK